MYLIVFNKKTPSTYKAVTKPKPRSIIFWSAIKWSQILDYELSDWAVKSLYTLFTVSELRFFLDIMCAQLKC